MRKIFICIALLITFRSEAQKKDTVFANSALQRATVYYGTGAELEHRARINFLSGMQQVIIDGLSTQADPASLRLTMPENITVMSFHYRVYQKPVERRPSKPGKEADTLKLLQKELAAYYNDQLITEDLLRRTTLLIENNFTTPDKKNISSEELIRLTNFYNAKTREYKEKIFQLTIKRDLINEKIAAINQRMSNENPVAPEDGLNTGQLIMQVMASAAMSDDLDITYYTRNAGWIPAYDIRLKTIDNSLKLAYRASVTQTTGISWEGVKLNLSTSNPNQANRLPQINPLFLRLYVPVVTNFYEKDMSLKPAPQLNEVVITAYDSKKNSGSAYSMQRLTAQQLNDVSGHTTLRESQLNINFEIDLPYTIPSDGQAYTVNIKDEKLKAGYKHFSIPVLDQNAFLVASLNRWDSLGLLPGEASIIMDNVFLGKSFIDPNSTADTLLLSLGRDKRISIERELVREFSKKTSKGNFKIETYTYEITVRNNKKQPVTIDVTDQYPLSTVKDVEVQLTEEGNADIDREKGFLKWNLSLAAGEKRVLRFAYQVKYPLNATLSESR